MVKPVWQILGLSVEVLLTSVLALSQANFTATTDQTTHNVGSDVRLRIFRAGAAGSPQNSSSSRSAQILATIRYEGETRPVATDLLVSGFTSAEEAERSGAYERLWKVPLEARTGRYEIDLEGRDAATRQAIWRQPDAASFAVHRKLVQIESITLDKAIYTSGDPVGAVVTVKNLAPRELSSLRVEFSDRYWPWIAQSSERAGVDVFVLAPTVSLPADGEEVLRSNRAAVSASVKEPAIHQYAAVVWDAGRREVYDIAFSPIVIIQPPGVDRPKPYPGQFLYPKLSDVNVSSYRRFYPLGLDSPAIQFDTSHTMFPSGSDGEVVFSVTNPTEKPWRRVSLRVRLLAPDGSEVESKVVARDIELAPRAVPLKKTARLDFPPAASGVYRAEARAEDTSGQVLASAVLELGVNPLPKSILVFCAHEDDEGAHAGIIRAAVENHIPIHFVYFTSGDAGSCDRYYQHSCGPAEALNFGAIRMEETRAALGHLGIPPENINFLGLPDGGSGEIWFNHREASNPYLSVLLACDRAPYEGLARPNLPYARESVVEAAKEFIKKFQPEVVYTGHPDERHVDHRTNNWFVVKALQELSREGALPPNLVLRVDQVYGPGPQTHAPYHYQKHVLSVSGEAMALAQEAWWFYQSQDGNRAEGRLRTFSQLPRTEVHWQVLDWREHEEWNERP